MPPTRKKPTIAKIAFMQEIVKRFNTAIVDEYKFHPKRKWRIDYYMPEYGLAIEVEGGIYTYGRHTRSSGFIADIEKYNEITAHGMSLIRVQPKNLNKACTFELIARCIENLSRF